MAGSSTRPTPIERLIDAGSGWPGVTLGPHPYDGVEFLLDDYEFGHAHRGWESLHINYPRRIRDALIETGRTNAHPYFSNSGWTSRPVDTDDDLEAGRWLLRVSYLYRALTRRRKPAGRAVLAGVDVETELDDLGVDGDVRAVFDDLLESTGIHRIES